jgi:2-oxoglutarate dehydrogenase E1 component
MSNYQNFKKSGAFFGGNAPFVEEIYERYAQDPASVDDSWRRFFENVRPDGNIPSYHSLAKNIAARSTERLVNSVADSTDNGKQAAVNRLTSRYRFLGARVATINPLQYDTPELLDLQPETHGLGGADMDTIFATDIRGLGGQASLRNILSILKKAYCGSMVVEFTHISRQDRRVWLRERIETPRPTLSSDNKKRLLERLLAAELLEKYLHTRYVGQKRFSLEGGDTLIPMLDTLLNLSLDGGMKEVVIGMAHRGRLNVLVNILGKHPSELFMEFEGKHKAVSGSGDVKYHMGFSSAYRARGKEMHLALAFNPSHLEIANPAVEGSVRARQDRRGDARRKTVLPVLIHGDAAFAGQGVVMETLNFSQVRGFKNGGTVNIIINNQIGFTTSTPDDARSTFFCSDVAKTSPFWTRIN